MTFRLQRGTVKDERLVVRSEVEDRLILGSDVFCREGSLADVHPLLGPFQDEMGEGVVCAVEIARIAAC